MDKEQKALLVHAWELHAKIVKDIGRLAIMSPLMAYGCIRSAETMIDVLMVDDIRKRVESKDE